jgi:sirohydrochlorin ferrochelatase
VRNSKTQPTAIVVFAHGSAVREANEEVSRLAEEVSRRAGCPAKAAFLEIARPDLAAAIAEGVASGARRIVVVPYFLTMGVHVRQDLPRLIAEQRARYPQVDISAAQSLEGYPGMADALLDRAREALQEALKEARKEAMKGNDE